ncbi:hypothetical protein OIU79_003590 [Salix purpurea]|uniref:Uncharacterized protein n=1 Tax=Salix purpurea TaxID=77065 RepID=A0A9Q0UM57_SALPP|nr:hypothetical protein OIU79_003590 [Salix purpurea]
MEILAFFFFIWIIQHIDFSIWKLGSYKCFFLKEPAPLLSHEVDCTLEIQTFQPACILSSSGFVPIFSPLESLVNWAPVYLDKDKMSCNKIIADGLKSLLLLVISFLMYKHSI